MSVLQNVVTSDTNHLNIGDDIGLTNKDQTLQKILIGAGWDIISLEGTPLDLDLSCFILGIDGETRRDEDFVFYNNPHSAEDEVRHLGDSRTGAGEGDDEQIEVDLTKLSYDASDIMIVLSIHEGDVNNLDFSIIRNLFIRFINANSDNLLCRLDIPDSFLESPKGTAMILGKIFRDGPKWRFHACTEIIEGGTLRSVATGYGLIVP